MALNLHTRRVLSGLAASGLLTLGTAVPAAAIPDPGPPRPDPGSTTPIIREVDVPVDDNAVELLQVGIGALGGIALASAFSARPRRHAGTDHGGDRVSWSGKSYAWRAR